MILTAFLLVTFAIKVSLRAGDLKPFSGGGGDVVDVEAFPSLSLMHGKEKLQSDGCLRIPGLLEGYRGRDNSKDMQHTDDLCRAVVLSKS